MREGGRDDVRIFGEPRGKPERPLLEAFILFIAFYLPSFAFSGASGASASRPGYHLAILAINLPRAILVLYIMASSDGLRAFEIAGLRPVDCARGLLCALGAFAVALAPASLYSAIGAANPWFAQARSEPHPGAALVPLILASSMVTGYCEELFFRFYLLRRLAQSGLPPLWAAIASSLVFGSLHGDQGIVGIVSATLLGLFFAWRRNETGNIHEIAIGHGLFDAATFAILIYS